MKLTHHLITNRRWFTLVELIIGMTIFVVWMTAILTLLNSAVSSSQRSKNEIIAANILREQVELVKNIRNTNVRSFALWSSWIVPNLYTIENDYSNSLTTYTNGIPTSWPVKMTTSTILQTDWLKDRFEKARLYIDDKWRFTHAITSTGSNIASYITITPLQFSRPAWTPLVLEPKDRDGNNQWYILDARVIINSSGFREYDLKTVITDWQK